MHPNRLHLPRKTVINCLIVLEYLLCAAMIWFTFAKNTALVSSMFMFSFFVLLAIYILNFSRYASKLFLLSVLIIILCFLSVLFSWRRYQVSLSLEGLKNYFLFCSTILYCYTAVSTPITKKLAMTILFLCLAISALFPIGYVVFHFSPNAGRFFTMNFSNPNLTGMFLLQAVMFALLGMVLLKHPLLKIFCLGLAAVNTVLLYWTDARNSLIALVLAVALAAWCVLLNRTKLPKLLLTVLPAFPLVFVFLYLKLIPAIEQRGILDFLTGIGKGLDSRVTIWSSHFQNLKSSWLVGDYFLLGGNAHNSLMVVLSSFGVIALLLVIYYLYLVMRKINNTCASKKQAFCLVAFCATLFMGLGEGAFFCGAVGLYALSCTPLLLARADWT